MIFVGYSLGMYLRSTKRQNRDGSTVEYYALAENIWNTAKQRSEPRRVCRRLQSLRGWSHGNKEEALTEIFT